jgi:hypothetical protein
MPCALDQSSIAVARAPDWLTNASLPGAALPGAKLAFSPSPGTSRPMQLGPRIRSRCGRAASSMACSSVDPSSAAGSFSPAVRTMAARVPLWPSCEMRSGTVRAGLQMMASSGAAGSESTSGHAAPPATVAWRGLTGQMAPSKPPAFKFESTTAPTLPGLSEAPITAIDRGWKRDSRLRTLIAWPIGEGKKKGTVETRRWCACAAPLPLTYRNSMARMRQTSPACARSRPGLSADHRINPPPFRIANGSFGRCMECGEPIDLLRLAAVPTSAYCTACQSLREQPARHHG